MNFKIDFLRSHRVSLYRASITHMVSISSLLFSTAAQQISSYVSTRTSTWVRCSEQMIKTIKWRGCHVLMCSSGISYYHSFPSSLIWKCNYYQSMHKYQSLITGCTTSACHLGTKVIKVKKMSVYSAEKDREDRMKNR